MSPSKSKNTSQAPQLTDSDLNWLGEKIGIKNLCVTNWKSVDYMRMIEKHLNKNKNCELSDKNEVGNTPLHLIAISENYAAIEGLLMCGADVNEVNNSGQTPIIYSHHCPDYNVGFQFFRHLHKLNFLGQYVNKQNSMWKKNMIKTYDERYPRGYLTAFLHDPSVTEETIRHITSHGDNAISQIYQDELRKIANSRVRKNDTLDKVSNLTNRLDVVGNRLKKLKMYTDYQYFHKNFPIFGCIIKQKLRQSLKIAKDHGLVLSCNVSPCESPKKKSVNQRPSDKSPNSHKNYAKNLKKEAEQGMKEFMARKDTVIVNLMNDLKINGTTEQQGVAYDYSFSVRNRVANVPDDELSSDEKLERMRKFMTKLQGSGA